MEHLITATLVLIEMISFKNLNSAFFVPKNDRKLNIIYLSVYLLQVIYFVLLDTNALQNVVFSLLTFFCLSTIISKGDWKKRSIIVIIFVVILYAADYVVMFVMVNLLSVTAREIIGQADLFIIGALSGKFIVFLATYFVYKSLKTKSKSLSMTIMQWIEVLLFALFSLLSLYIVMERALDSNTIDISLIIYAVAIIACNIIIFSIIVRLEEENSIKNQHAVLQQQMKIETQSAIALSQAYSQQRKITHDFNNHILTLQSLIEAGFNEKATEYLKLLAKNTSESSVVVNSNNPVVDAVINQKYLRSKKIGVDMQLMIGDISELPMSIENSVVLISNLLDNAIEAAEKCLSKRVVRVKIVREKNEYVLSVYNTMTTSGEESINSDFKTTKKDSVNHGFGLKNIKSILNLYGYNYTIEIDNGWFKFTALIL